MISKILISVPLLAVGALLVLASWGFLGVALDEGDAARKLMAYVFGFVHFLFAILPFAALFWLWGL